MRYATIIFLFITFSSYEQSSLVDQVDKKRLEIEKQISNEECELIILVKIKGEIDLQRVLEENWPEKVETTYNILKNQNGEIIFIGEIPTSESGDWYLELRHYFTENGNILAFKKRLSYFNDNCGDGVVIEEVTELFNNEFKIIKSTKTLTDQNGKNLTGKECSKVFNWEIDKRSTVKEFVHLKQIRE